MIIDILTLAILNGQNCNSTMCLIDEVKQTQIHYHSDKLLVDI